MNHQRGGLSCVRFRPNAQKHRFSDLEQLKAFMLAKLAAITVHSNREGGQVESQKGDTEWQGIK